ncbi:hypothetical protein BpHYR1_043711 [Brachionus plicatilis]|uniref:Uncharacterized protein n=1 Tax=Brachionus plicatilis TaxID=10195 RepID=A0A3M7T4P5_BRAPC|nr:hypothetical protein BpHYR1_043711 [Brachionus plicatilis]
MEFKIQKIAENENVKHTKICKYFFSNFQFLNDNQLCFIDKAVRHFFNEQIMLNYTIIHFDIVND